MENIESDLFYLCINMFKMLGNFFHLRVCFALAGDPVEKSKIKVIQANSWFDSH